MEWMLLPFRRYADFSGRSRRMEYWMFLLLELIVMIAFTAILFATTDVGASFSEGSVSSPLLSGIGLILLLVFLAIFLVPGIAVVVRRWHDLGQSGWFFLLFLILGLIPFIGFVANLANLIWFCMPGTTGPNKYGDDPMDAPLTTVGPII